MSYKDLKNHVVGKQSDEMEQDSRIVKLVESLADYFARLHHNQAEESERDNLLSQIASLSNEDLSSAIDYCMWAINKDQQDKNELLALYNDESIKNVTKIVSANLTMYYEKVLETLSGFKNQDKANSFSEDGM